MTHEFNEKYTFVDLDIRARTHLFRLLQRINSKALKSA